MLQKIILDDDFLSEITISLYILLRALCLIQEPEVEGITKCRLDLPETNESFSDIQKQNKAKQR